MKKLLNTQNQTGQIIILILLVMLVALAVGLTVTQRTITDISTSTQVEEASRAFSAAEAGINKAISQELTNPSNSLSISESQLGNQSSANVKITYGLPRAGQALEYFPVGKETTAQFWLSNPLNLGDLTNPSTLINHYRANDVLIYFGTDEIATDKPSIEVNLIVKDQAPNGEYISLRRWYNSDTARTVTNNFLDVNNFTARDSSVTREFNCIVNNGYSIVTTNSPDSTTNPPDRHFFCRLRLSLLNTDYAGINPFYPIMLRIRVLYSNGAQPIAVAPSSGSLPPQATIYTSVGSSGQSQKTVQVFRLNYVVPQMFDFSIFSAGNINK